VLAATPTGAKPHASWEGDFSPGLVRLSASAEPAGTTLLSMDATANLRDVNWITRAHGQNATPWPSRAWQQRLSMSCLRALRLQAERVGDAPDVRRQPASPPSPPELSEL